MEAHCLAWLPNPVLTPYPPRTILSQDTAQPGNFPPQAPRSTAGQELDKLQRALDATFLCTWEIYQDAAKKLAINLEHF
jgi:hypothetical protein